MFKSIAAAAGAAVAVLGLAAPTQASVDGAWSQHVYHQVCVGGAQGDPDGGILKITLRGQEKRLLEQDFQTAWVNTHWIVEREINGVWTPLFGGPTRRATTPIDFFNPNDGYWHAPFHYSSHFRNQNHPVFVAPVNHNGTYRLHMTSQVYQQDGVQVAELDDWTVGCTFAG